MLHAGPPGDSLPLPMESWLVCTGECVMPVILPRFCDLVEDWKAPSWWASRPYRSADRHTLPSWTPGHVSWSTCTHGACLGSLISGCSSLDFRLSSFPGEFSFSSFWNLLLKLLLVVCVSLSVACNHYDIPGSLHLFQGISMFTRLQARLTFSFQLRRALF